MSGPISNILSNQILQNQLNKEFLALEAAIGQPIPVPAPSGATLTAADTGQLYTDQGSSGTAVFALPVAAAGLNFGFAVVSHGIQVVADGVHVINWGGIATSAGGTLTSTTVGDFMALIAVNTSLWIVKQGTGSWTPA